MRENKKTFKEWTNSGYLIIKGSKAIAFNDKGEALFSRDQVKKKNIPSYEYKYEGVDYSKDPEFWAKASPNQMYKHMILFPEKYKNMSTKAGSTLADNIW